MGMILMVKIITHIHKAITNTQNHHTHTKSSQQKSPIKFHHQSMHAPKTALFPKPHHTAMRRASIACSYVMCSMLAAPTGPMRSAMEAPAAASALSVQLAFFISYMVQFGILVVVCVSRQYTIEFVTYVCYTQIHCICTHILTHTCTPTLQTNTHPHTSTQSMVSSLEGAIRGCPALNSSNHASSSLSKSYSTNVSSL